MQKSVHLKLPYVLLPILSLAFFFASCGRGEHYPFTLLQADSLMDARPDSSLKLLEAFAADSLNVVSKSVRMYYTLLRTTADDRNYITHTSDSVMRIVVDYYQKHGPADKLARSYYVLGRVYDDMHNYPTALDYYHKAIDATTPLKNYRLLGLTYSQIGTLYVYQGLYEDCVDAYRKSYKYGILSNDNLRINAYLQGLARAFTATGEADSALFYYKKVFKNSSNNYRKKHLIGEISSIYLQLNDYVNARRYLQYDRSLYTGWADYYLGLAEIDSAKVFYELSLKTSNIYAREEACRRLSEFAEAENNHLLVIRYLKKADLLRDSILNLTKSSEIKRIEALYNYEKLEAERNSLKFEKTVHKYVFVILLSVMLIFVSFLYILNRKRLNRLSYIEDQNRRLRFLAEIVEQSGFNVSEGESCVRTLMNINTPICEKIKNEALNEDFCLPESKWGYLEHEMNLLYSNFSSRLRTLYPRISKTELVVCCLIKLNVRNRDIAHIISRSENAISSLRSRLYTKIHCEKGSSKQFNDFIVDF